MISTPSCSSSPDAASVPEQRWLWAAFGWGLAEATFFFIVPDVLTSHVVIRRTRTGFLACLAALAGALVGGSALFWIGTDSGSRETALAACTALPGIDAPLVAQAKAGLGSDGLLALFSGVLAGVPYKLYALQAAPAGIGFGAFFVASIVARAIRFLAVTILAWAVSAILLRKINIHSKLRIHWFGWMLFYAGYFWRMGL